MSLDIEYIPERHVGRWVALAIFILILAAGGWFVYSWYTSGNLPISIPVASANGAVSEVDVSYNDVKSYEAGSNQPRYISIPALSLGKTRIYPVGLNSNNLVEDASNIHDVTWYTKSTAPGDGGVVLINGHNKGINKNGAFYNLSTLSSSDKISIERGDGKSLVYDVVDVQTISLDEFNSKGLALLGTSASQSKEGLNLVTFDGKWVPRLGTFDQRTIVRAVIDDSK